MSTSNEEFKLLFTGAAVTGRAVNTTMKIRQILERIAPPGEIHWTPEHALGTVYTVVWVDVAKVEASWRTDPDFYVGAGGAGGIKGRYPRFDEFVRSGVPIHMSRLSLDRHGRAFFGNGRHRFAWMRDHGVTAVPVMVDKEQAEEIVKAFGTSQRQSIVRMPGNK